MSGSSNLQILITGDGSAEDYLQLLHAARLQVGSNTFNTGGSVDITVDGNGGSATATTAVDIPNRHPDLNVFSGNTASATVPEADLPPEASGTLTLIDSDRDQVSLTVTDIVAEGPLGGHSSADDFLGFLSITPETTSGDYSSEQVTWTFAPNNETFDYLGDGQSLILHYSIHASDGVNADGEVVTITINGTNDAPVVDAHDASVNYTVGDPGIAIDSDVALSDVDSATLHGATVTIDNFQDGDTLIFAGLGDITGEYNPETGVLTLTGDAGVGDYQAALRSISYQNIYPYASTEDRTISYQVDDGSANNHASNVATSTIHVDAGGGGEIPNEAPVIHTNAAYTSGDYYSTTLAGLSVTDADEASGEHYAITASALHGTLSVSEVLRRRKSNSRTRSKP